MSDRYTSFDTFLEEVSKARESERKMSVSWLKAVGAISGAGIASGIAAGLLPNTRKAILPATGAVAVGALLGGIAGPAGIAGAMIAGRSLMSALTGASDDDEASSFEGRISEARVIWEELTEVRPLDEEDREEIDLLFEALVDDTAL